MKAARLCVLTVLLWLYGCSMITFVRPHGPPSNAQIYAAYLKTELNQSTSADVLATIVNPKYELLSQSKSIIASAGRQKVGRKIWFNMVAFDEQQLVARRKYICIADERPKQLFVEPWEGVAFDCQIVLPREVLDEPYTDENARRIAIIRRISADMRKDTTEIGGDNEIAAVCGMVANQGFDSLLVKLDVSHALAAKLSDPAGLEFENVSFNKGLLRMSIDGEVVSIKMRLGSFAKNYQLNFETIP